MKILLIKLGADGDVLRTIPLADALKKKYPGARIIWVTKGDIFTLLEGNPSIDEVKTLPWESDDEFDALYNFDADEIATAIAMKTKAKKKYGFYSEGGYPAAFNIGAEYYLNTMFDDEFKKKNRKTYQEMMFEAAGMPYEKVPFKIALTEGDKKYAQDFIRKNKVNPQNLIGIHMGASPRWPSKAWHEDCVAEFVTRARKSGHEIILFGGPNEAEKHHALAERLKKEGINIYRNEPGNTKRQFAALVSLCKAMVCSDSFALHVAIGLGKKTIGLFFVTSPYEVEGYGLLTKVVAPKLTEFFPERSNEYNEELARSISAETVLRALNTGGNK